MLGGGVLTLLELSFIRWRCWHLNRTRIHVRHSIHKEITQPHHLQTHTHLSSFHDRTSLMNVVLRRLSRGTKATLTLYRWQCCTQRNPHMSTFQKIVRLQAAPRVACVVKGWGMFLHLSVMSNRYLEAALVHDCYSYWSGALKRPFGSTIPTLSVSICLCRCAAGTLSWYPTHTVSVLWPHSSDCINWDYGRIILVCLAIKYAHVWLFKAASQTLIGTSPSLI